MCGSSPARGGSTKNRAQVVVRQGPWQFGETAKFPLRVHRLGDFLRGEPNDLHVVDTVRGQVLRAARTEVLASSVAITPMIEMPGQRQGEVAIAAVEFQQIARHRGGALAGQVSIAVFTPALGWVNACSYWM